MNQKNIWWWVGGAIIIIIVLVVVGLFISGTTTKPKVTPTPQITVSKQVIQKDDGVSKVDIEYPLFEGAPQAINDKIQEILNARIQEFKKIAAENEQARIDTNKQLPASEQRPARPDATDSWYMLYIRYATGIVDTQKISAIFFIDEYSGGAHGNKSFIPFNYNNAQNKEITLADVFPNTPDYLQLISQFVYTDIVKQINAQDHSREPDMGWIQTGTAPLIDNFSNFTLGENSITFYIPPYQVAAYAYGDFQVTMPLN